MWQTRNTRRCNTHKHVECPCCGGQCVGLWYLPGEDGESHGLFCCTKQECQKKLMAKAGSPFDKWDRYYQSDIDKFDESEWEESCRRTIVIMTHNPAPPAPRKRKRKNKRKRKHKRKSECTCKYRKVMRAIMRGYDPDEFIQELKNLREQVKTIEENVADCAEDVKELVLMDNHCREVTHLSRMQEVLMFTSSEASAVKDVIERITSPWVR